MTVRIDGRSFHKFTQEHLYEKPNDKRGLGLMNACAKAVMEEFKDIVIAYGESDEYSFVFGRGTSVFGRRGSKIVSLVASIFSSNFVFLWKNYFPNEIPLQSPPAFDARVICYPSIKNVKDYLSWRQADCHINNLYNTCFWALVKDGATRRAASTELAPTNSALKNELLFSRFGLNYNNVDAIFRKGTVILREQRVELVTKIRKDTGEQVKTEKKHSVLCMTHCDIIGEQFWVKHPSLLSAEKY